MFPKTSRGLQQRGFFPEAILTGSIFIEMEEVDKLWELVKDKAKIKTNIADREYWMRDFSILDNNGYELVFGEDMSFKHKLTTCMLQQLDDYIYYECS